MSQYENVNSAHLPHLRQMMQQYRSQFNTASISKMPFMGSAAPVAVWHVLDILWTLTHLHVATSLCAAAVEFNAAHPVRHCLFIPVHLIEEWHRLTQMEGDNPLRSLAEKAISFVMEAVSLYPNTCIVAEKDESVRPNSTAADAMLDICRRLQLLAAHPPPDRVFAIVRLLTLDSLVAAQIITTGVSCSMGPHFDQSGALLLHQSLSLYKERVEAFEVERQASGSRISRVSIAQATNVASSSFTASNQAPKPIDAEMRAEELIHAAHQVHTRFLQYNNLVTRLLVPSLLQLLRSIYSSGPDAWRSKSPLPAPPWTLDHILMAPAQLAHITGDSASDDHMHVIEENMKPLFAHPLARRHCLQALQAYRVLHRWTPTVLPDTSLRVTLSERQQFRILFQELESLLRGLGLWQQAENDQLPAVKRGLLLALSLFGH